MKKFLKVLLKIVITIIFILGLLMTYLILTANRDGISNIAGYIPISMNDDSMEPTIMNNDLILVKKTNVDNLKNNDVIAYLSQDIDKNVVVTHRIYNIKKKYSYIVFVTKGDNNGKIDKYLVYTNNIVGIYNEKHIPYLGAVYNFLKTQIGFLTCIIIPLLIFFMYEIIRLIGNLINNKNKSLEDDIIAIDKESEDILEAPIVVDNPEFIDQAKEFNEENNNFESKSNDNIKIDDKQSIEKKDNNDSIDNSNDDIEENNSANNSNDDIEIL